MFTKSKDSEIQLGSLKNESARQRWELFHRAIAHAKQSNHDELKETEAAPSETKHVAPVLSIAR